MNKDELMDTINWIRTLFDSNDELQTFFAWSGIKQTEQLTNMPEMWNKLHGHFFTISQKDLLQDTLPKMIAIWKLQRCEKDVNEDPVQTGPY